MPKNPMILDLVKLKAGTKFKLPDGTTVMEVSADGQTLTITATESIGTSEIDDGAVTTAKLADDALSADASGRAKVETDFFDTATIDDVFEDGGFNNANVAAKFGEGSIKAGKLGTDDNGSTVTGVKKTLYIKSATVKALLDTGANTLATFPTGTVITDVFINTSTPAGSAGTVDIGTDSNWTDASNGDAFVDGFNLNAGGAFRLATQDVSGATSALKGVEATDNANVTIQSSADLSASSWTGSCTIEYIETA